MAVTVTQNVVELTAQGDQVAQGAVVQSVRVVADVSSLAGDVVELTDPVTGGVLWQTKVVSSVGAEAELTASGSKSGRTWRNGFRLNTLTGDRGTVYVSLA